MRVQLAAALLAVSVLTGCSQVMGFVHGDWIDDENVTPVAASRPQPPQGGASVAPPPADVATTPDSSFCRSVATSDSALVNFDAATQKTMIAQSYRQCIAIFGGAN